MNSRERFQAVANGQPVDQMPFFEEEIRDDVLEAWRKHGMPAHLNADTYRSYFGLDRIDTVPVRFSPQRGELTKASDFKRIMRDYEERPVKFLTPAYWQEKAQQYEKRDFPLGIIGWNGFQLPFFPPSPHVEHNEWQNMVNLYYQIKDNPAAAREALRFVTDYYISIVTLALRYVRVDFVNIREPIASPTGTVISPRDFASLVLPIYPRLIAAYRRLGIPVILFSSISNVSAILPPVLDCGFDGLQITQLAQTSISYTQIGQRYPQLLLLGGIDATMLLQSRNAVVGEVKHKAIPMRQRKHWLPALDDTVRANVPYQRFLTYRKALMEYTAKHQGARPAR
jgi:hypothetical protein